MIIVYKALVSLTSVFKTCYSPNLERADFDRQSFQYTWLNSYFFSSSAKCKNQERSGPPWTTLRHFPDASLRESSKTQTYWAIRNYLVVAI